jgi:hypothetical protein
VIPFKHEEEPDDAVYIQVTVVKGPHSATTWIPAIYAVVGTGLMIRDEPGWLVAHIWGHTTLGALRAQARADIRAAGRGKVGWSGYSRDDAGGW